MISSFVQAPNILDLIEGGYASDDEFVEAANVMAAMTAAIKEVKERWEAAAIKHLGERTVECGSIRWYVGKTKTTKCIDQRELLRTLLEVGGLEVLDRCLSSGAFKHGACKEPLGEDWPKHFTVEEKPSLEEGVAKKKLQRLDVAFLPKPKGEASAD